MRLRLGTRLMLFFLGALAVALVGFSGSLYLLAAKYLDRQVDDRLDATLNTLVAAAEIKPDCVEWEPAERSLSFGRRTVEGRFFWSVFDPEGRRLDGSVPDEADRQVAGGPPADASGRGPRTIRDGKGVAWRVMSRRLEAERPSRGDLPRGRHGNARGGFYKSLAIAAGMSLEGVHATLRNLAIASAGLSVGLWTSALFCGGTLCRRAIRPLTEMAEAAHAIGGDEPEGRLPVPRADDEMAELGRSFNALLDRLHESFVRQQRFTGDASHQLRTPLTVIQGNIDLALRQPRSEDEYRRVLSVVRRKAHHMAQIVEALLFLARADAESHQPRLEPIEPEPWVRDHLRVRQGPRSADIRLEVADDLACNVRVQPPLLAELLDNLLDNAAKYSAPGTPIVVRLGQSDRSVRLSVEDRGIGIAEKEIPHIFDPFYRSPEARQGGTSGQGLGLSVAARLARSFGGRLDVESRPGQGSVFTLILPAGEITPPQHGS